jgi:hypothetical protein
MGRKNRKGRTSNQNPRRFHRTARSRGRRGEDRLSSDGRAARDPAAVNDPDWMPYPELDYRRPLTDGERSARQRPNPLPVGASEFAGSDSLVDAAVMLCGRCTEWVPRDRSLGFDERGECLHPASGIAYPPVNMEACPYFH